MSECAAASRDRLPSSILQSLPVQVAVKWTTWIVAILLISGFSYSAFMLIPQAIEAGRERGDMQSWQVPGIENPQVAAAFADATEMQNSIQRSSWVMGVLSILMLAPMLVVFNFAARDRFALSWLIIFGCCLLFVACGIFFKPM